MSYYISLGNTSADLIADFGIYEELQSATCSATITGIKIEGNIATFRAEFKLNQLLPEMDWGNVEVGNNRILRAAMQLDLNEVDEATKQTLVTFSNQLDAFRSKLYDQVAESVGEDSEEFEEALAEEVADWFPSAISFRPKSGSKTGVQFPTLSVGADGYVVFYIEELSNQDGSRSYWQAVEGQYGGLVAYTSSGVVRPLGRHTQAALPKVSSSAPVAKAGSKLPSRR